MKNIVIRFGFLLSMFSTFSTNVLLGQVIEDNTPFIEEKTGYNPVDSLKNIEEEILLTQKQSLKRQETALQNVYSALIDKEDLKDFDFDWGEIFIKAIVSTGASIADDLKNTSVFGFAYSVAAGIYDENKEYQRLKSQNIKIRDRNGLVSLFASYREMNTYALERIQNKKKDGEVYKSLLEKYEELPPNSERIKYLADLRTDAAKTSKNLPGIKSLELMYYQEILAAMYSSKKRDAGYIEIIVDYTERTNIDKWEHSEKIFPNNVKISIKAGVFSKKLEKEINALTQTVNVKERSVLELKDIPQHVYIRFKPPSNFPVKSMDSEILLPIIYWKGVITPPWGKEYELFEGKILCQAFSPIGSQKTGFMLPTDEYKDILLTPYKHMSGFQYFF